MKFSKSWLQGYIVELLPNNEAIIEVLNKKAFEVEETILITKSQTSQTDADLADDTVFDIKVLPNRAHDALGHSGMARELCADFGYTFKEDIKVSLDEKIIDSSVSIPSVAIDDIKSCTRFMSVRIDGVTVGESPTWLKEQLEAIGQRSINNIVDITNYVQFSVNKPMHAYDARSIKGTLRARFAKKGETLTTLDDKELKLDEKTLVIADDEKTLGLAGVKGGKFSGIKSDTTSIILESANFESVLIRKTSEKYNIKTDASKRFENGITDTLVADGLYMTVNCIKELFPHAKVSAVTDIYPKEVRPYHVGISLSELNNILGSKYSDSDIKTTLKQLNFKYKKIIPEDEIVTLANSAVGALYHLGASVLYDSPDMFDCSSLTSWLYVHSGVGIPRISIDQYVYTKRVESSGLQIGDLIFANNDVDKVYTSSIEFLPNTQVSEGINHVGMYIGNGNVVHATSMHEKVVIEDLGTSPRFAHTVGYGRVLDNVKEERYVVEVPSERLDIRIKEDLAEELGRILGYEKLKPILPKLNRTGLQHKRMYYENKIRTILLEKGFSEVMTYSFGDVGQVELVKGLADDKEKLRENLGKGLLESLTRNLHNAPLLGTKTVKIFEIGNVFSNNSESRHFAIAIDDGGKKTNFTEEVDMILAEIKRTLGVKDIECQTVSTKPYCIEIVFDALIATLEEPKEYEAPTFATLPPVSYKTVSPYPFIARDIAMWVPSNITWENINTLCTEVGNALVARVDLFDTFTKEIEGVKKTSYAFRLVFQSYEKTLTDEEVNIMMEAYYTVFKEKGFEIR